jgi:hypothetical protein
MFGSLQFKVSRLPITVVKHPNETLRSISERGRRYLSDYPAFSGALLRRHFRF